MCCLKSITHKDLIMSVMLYRGHSQRTSERKGGGGSGESGRTWTKGEGVFAHCGRPDVQNITTRHVYYSSILD